ncbi:hypothetical protein B5P43_28940 [Bacillus sp. SRB_336]|nr:hypothetical protein B5P43_28940 [Bacillus sp. SRB_336]
MAEQHGGNREGNSQGRSGGGLNGDNRGVSGGRRYGERPPAGDRKERKPYTGPDDRGGQGGRPYGDRPARSGGDRPYGDRDDRGGQGGRPYGDRDDRGGPGGRPYGDRDDRGGQGGRPYGDRPARSGGDRPYGSRDDRGGQGGDRPYGDRPARSGGDRPYGSRDDRGGQGGRPYGDRPARSGGDRPYGNRDDRGAQGGRPSADRPARTGGDRPYDNRGNRGTDRPMVNGRREDRKPFGDRGQRGSDRPYGNRDDRGSAGDRDSRRDGHGERPARHGGDRPYSSRPQGGREDSGPRTPPPRNSADLRSSNRADRARSPEIDKDVTGEELDKVTRAQLRILDSRNNEWVSKHLVMAGRLIDFEPELAFEHALAASRRGGRLACVREAVAMTAYAAGNYSEALRELRTYRRISGSNVHLPLMADCERGLGRPDKALDLIQSEEAQTLDTAGKVELAIVESGARGDLGDLDAALSVLEIPQLDMNRAFSFSPRLFRAYAMVLRAADRKAEAKTWDRQALVAEEALGLDDSTDSIIVDLGDDEDIPLDEPRVRVSDVMEPASAPASAGQEKATNEHDETEVDDAESDYFESDDVESDEDSAEEAVDQQDGDRGEPEHRDED